MTTSPCCGKVLLRLPSVPSEEAWACSGCGHQYYRQTWADMETPDAKEIYHYHWAKIKTFATCGVKVQGEKVSGAACTS